MTEAKQTYRPTIAVDLDGVLAQYNGWKGVEHIGPPIPGAGPFMERLMKLGKVMVYTTRTNTLNLKEGHNAGELVERVTNWLVTHNIPHDGIHHEGGKPLCAVIIDDRAVCCRPQANGPTQFDIAVAGAEFMISRGQQKEIDWV